ncbi:ABC transporter C-terminal domain-containing protein, partial [Cohnella nanjingensis]
PAHTVLEEVWSEFKMLPEAEIRTVLGNFLFSGEDVRKSISSLSGGEKARVALSKLMLRKANVLVLDEPTNHLDLWSREVLEASLEEYDGTLLFVSHDRYFLNRLADRIVELQPDGAVHFLGNYDEMVSKKKEIEEWKLASSGPAATASSAPAADYEAEKQAKRDERARQRKREQAEAEIARLETEIAAIEEEMATPEVSVDFVKLKEKQTAVEERQTALEEAYAIWEALME